MKIDGTNYLKPNIQLFAEPAPAADPAPADPAPANPNPTPAEPTKPEEPAQPFKSFASEADYQKELDFRVQQALKTHEEKLKGKLTPEIRKQLEAEANMTAEQKLQADRNALEADRKALAKEKVRVKAESLLSAKGISEADRSAMLDSLVDEDEDSSLKRTQALIDAIEKATNEKIKAAMAQVKAPSSGDDGKGKTGDKAVEYAKKLAERRAATAKTANAGLDYYIHGGKK